jgi:maleylacetoacetate isomerase
MRLHGYFRSSAAYRVRIALALKGLPYDQVPVHLARGEQQAATFRALSPQGLVPILEDGGATLTQSLAIIEYLDETHPHPPLLPRTASDRARVRSLAQTIACDLHPLNNLRVLRYLADQLGADEAARSGWYRHWMAVGLTAFEQLVRDDSRTGRFCHGDAPSLADLCLIPQLYNARRFVCPVDGYPTLLRIEAACQALEPFRAAAPERQPDAEA